MLPTKTASGGTRRHHAETSGRLPVAVREAFAYLDDHARLTSHMSKRSWMMAGSRMDVSLDERAGRGVGARILMSGRVLGLRLSLDETVTIYEPPEAKAWCASATRLLVIGDYEMGFRIIPARDGSLVRVLIDYDDPPGYLGRLLGPIAGSWYASWCTAQMVRDAQRHFASDRPAPDHPPG